MGWMSTMIMAEAMKRAGRELDGESFINAMETIKDFGGDGIGSPITYTPTSHKGSDYCRLYKADVEKGLLISVTGWRKPLPLEEVRGIRGR